MSLFFVAQAARHVISVHCSHRSAARPCENKIHSINKKFNSWTYLVILHFHFIHKTPEAGSSCNAASRPGFYVELCQKRVPRQSLATNTVRQKGGIRSLPEYTMKVLLNNSLQGQYQPEITSIQYKFFIDWFTVCFVNMHSIHGSPSFLFPQRFVCLHECQT